MPDYEKEMKKIDRMELCGLLLQWLGFVIIVLVIGHA